MPNIREDFPESEDDQELEMELAKELKIDGDLERSFDTSPYFPIQNTMCYHYSVYL